MHPPHPERQPAKAAFEHAERQTGIAVEKAAGEKPGHKTHCAQGCGHSIVQ